MCEHDDELPDAVALIASMLSIMTQFARTHCPHQAVLVERQLTYLQQYPDELMPSLLKTVARRLRGEWQRVIFELPGRVPVGEGTANKNAIIH